MATPDITWNAVSLLRAMKSILEDKANLLTSDYSRDMWLAGDVELVTPRSVWIGESVPNDYDTPGIGIYSEGSTNVSESSAIIEVDRNIVLTLVLADGCVDGTEGVTDVEDMHEVALAYMYVAQATLQKYLDPQWAQTNADPYSTADWVLMTRISQDEPQVLARDTRFGDGEWRRMFRSTMRVLHWQKSYVTEAA
ncbi:MAG: hypothetical protein KDA28_16835 [Phycisphaerales bacterium]|nr:hypothetical protein [Phycisphaerales bacterium]